MPAKKKAAEPRALPGGFPGVPARHTDPDEQRRFEFRWVTVTRLIGPPKDPACVPVLERRPDGTLFAEWGEQP